MSLIAGKHSQEQLDELYAHYCAAHASVNLEEQYTERGLKDEAHNEYRIIVVAMGAQDARSGFLRFYAAFEAAFLAQVKQPERET